MILHGSGGVISLVTPSPSVIVVSTCLPPGVIAVGLQSQAGMFSMTAGSPLEARAPSRAVGQPAPAGSTCPPKWGRGL